MAENEDIDVYGELGDLMRDLERRGVPDVEIIDAAFRLAMMGAARIYGTEAAAHSLRDVAELMEAYQDAEPLRVMH
jgi:hypothetical protein